MPDLTTTFLNLSVHEEEHKEEAYDLDQIQQITTDYILPTICVFGIICNIINFVILTRPQMKESPYTYLLALSMADLGVLVFVFINGVLSKHLGRGVYGWQVFDGFIFLPIANMFANSSVWITVGLTIERWVSVKFPLKAKELCTKKIARRTIGAIVTVVCIANIPRFFCRKIDVVTLDNGTSFYKLVSSEFEQSSAYNGITWMYITLIHIIPCLTLICLNICLLVVVYKANKERLGLNGAQHQNNIAVHISREQRRLTVTCVSIICLFLVCVIPTAFSNPPVAYKLFGRGQDKIVFFQHSVYRLLRVVTNTLLVCNLSLNFVLYCLFNHKFLKTLRHLTKIFVYKMCKIDIPESFHRMSTSSSGQNNNKKDNNSGSNNMSSNHLGREKVVSANEQCMSYQCMVTSSAVQLIKEPSHVNRLETSQLLIPLRSPVQSFRDDFV